MLQQQATFIKETQFEDVYLDNLEDYTLAMNNVWLRKRDNFFELKRGIDPKSEVNRANVDRYEEITEKTKIISILNKFFGTQCTTMEELESSKKIEPFATIQTRRKSYQWKEFSLDVDETNFGYQLAEIECQVDSKEKVEHATQHLLQFCQQNGIPPNQKVLGKLEKYILDNCPKLLKLLVKNGFLK